jgi:hypothetical protein
MPVALIVAIEVELLLRIGGRKDEGTECRWTGLHIRQAWRGGDLRFYMNLLQFRQLFMGEHDAQIHTGKGLMRNSWAITRQCHLWTRPQRQGALE